MIREFFGRSAASKIGATCAIAGFAFFGFVSRSCADIIDVTFDGTLIGTGFDLNGAIFGIVGPPASYTGSGISYSANFVFNTALGTSSNSPTQNSVSGGTSLGVPSPLVSASVTINGVTANVSGLYDSEIFACQTCGSPGELTLYAQDKSDNGSTTTNNVSKFYITGAIAGTLTSGTYTSSLGYVGVANVNFNTTADNPIFGTSVDTYFEALLTGVTVTDTVATTPLPSTWTMMLFGLAGLACAACRGTKKASDGLASVW
jgi:hypothetical protein